MTDVTTEKENQLPQTKEELYDFVVHAINRVLTDPTNVNRLARGMMNAGADALNQLDEMNRRHANRNQVVRTEYPGCVRAVLSATPEEEVKAGAEPMTVHLFMRDENKEWVPAQFDDANRVGLSKLVLSESSVVPGEVYYVARSFQIEALQDALIDQQLALATAEPDAVKH